MSHHPAPAPSEPRSHALDGLRGVSAQAVFLAHCAVMLTPGLPGHAALLLGVVARLAVVVFFVLSGFVIATSILARSRSGRFDLRGFAVARMARIYPPFLFAVALCFGYGWLAARGVVPRPQPLEGWPIDLSLAALGRALLFLYLQHDLMTRLDGPLWSLRLEVILYAVAAALAVAATWKGRWRVAALALAALLLAGMLKGLYGAALAIASFGFGAAAALRRERILAALPTGPVEAAALAGLGLAAVLLAGDHALGAGRPLALLPEAAAAALIALWVAHLSAGRGWLQAPLGRARPLGGFAYTLYIVHLPIIYLATTLQDWPAPALTALCAVGIELLAFAAAKPLENHRALVARLRGRAPLRR